MTNTLRIERLASTYLVPRDHPAPQKVRAEMDDLARRYVAESCGRALSPLLDPNDPSVWVISDVRIELLIDLHAAQADDVAAFWASRIAASVARAVSGGDDGVRVLRFPNRAAYLAHFVRNLADGCAWTKWYFAEFDSLRSLTMAAAIREALLREPPQAEASLMELASANCLARICMILSAHDQELIMACCAGDVTCSVDALRAVVQWMKRTASGKFSALETYAQIRRELADLRSSDAAGATACISQILRWTIDNKLRAIISELVRNRIPVSLVAPQEVDTLEVLRNVGIQDPSWLTTLPDRLPTNPEAEEGVYEFDSRLGFVFLLLPGLRNTPELFELFGGEKDALARYFLFLNCFAMKSRDAWRDSALRVAAGLRETPDAASLSRTSFAEVPASLETLALSEDVAYFNSYGGELLPTFVPSSDQRQYFATAAAVLLRTFARGLPAVGGSSVEYLWRNILSGDSRVRVAPNSITVRLAHRPLQIVLKMAGLKESRFDLPWLKGAQVIVRLDES